MSENKEPNDRLEANTQDGLALAVSAPAAYLGNPELVEQMVRDFFTVVFSERSKWHAGQASGDSVEARIAEVCNSYGRVFMGESPSYQAQPWNNPLRLGSYLRALIPDCNRFESPGAAYFDFLAVQALNAAIALEEGAMSEDEVKAGISEVVDDAVDVLLGRKAGARG